MLTIYSYIFSINEKFWTLNASQKRTHIFIFIYINNNNKKKKKDKNKFIVYLKLSQSVMPTVLN